MSFKYNPIQEISLRVDNVKCLIYICNNHDNIFMVKESSDVADRRYNSNKLYYNNALLNSACLSHDI